MSCKPNRWGMKFDRKTYGGILLAIIAFIIGMLSFKACSDIRDRGKDKPDIEIKKDTATNTVTITVEDKNSFDALKKENKKLHDSIAKLKNVESAIVYKYIYKYSTDTVYVKEETDEEIVNYEYSGGSEDTVQYNLLVGSSCEPSYYKLDFTLKDDFVIVTKNDDGITEVDIHTEVGEIENPIVVHEKKGSFWKRFAYGPSVTVGYDPFNKNLSSCIGFSVTYDLRKR